MPDERPKTRPERIDACVAKVAPKAHVYFHAHGRWPHPNSFAADGSMIPPAGTAADDQHRRCPYVIYPLSENRRRVTITNEDGETVSGVGATIEEAIAALEAKLS